MHVDAFHFNNLFLMFLSSVALICSRLRRRTHRRCIMLLLNSTMCLNLLYMANKDPKCFFVTNMDLVYLSALFLIGFIIR